MRKVLMFVLFFFWAVPVFAQVDTAWVRTMTGWGSGYVYDLAVDSSGNVCITGTVSMHSGDYLTIKYYPNGVTAWARLYNGPGNAGDVAFAIAVDGSGNIYVTGSSWGGLSTDYDYATIKYYPNGDIAWVSRYNGPQNAGDGAEDISVDGSRNVYVTGGSNTIGGWPYNPNYATVKYDSNGNEMWVRRFDGPVHAYDWAYAIAIDGSGNVCVTGQIQAEKGESQSSYPNQCATIKYTSTGNPVWVRTYSPNADSTGLDTVGWAGGRDIAVDYLGNVYVTGDSWDTVTHDDYATIKYYPNGDTAWIKRYHYNSGPFFRSEERPSAMVVDGYGNAYITGYVQKSPAYSDCDYLTIKYGPAGWVNLYNGPTNGQDEARDIAVDASGNVYVTGYSDGEWATVKYYPNGATAWVTRYSMGAGSAIAVDKWGNVYVAGTNGGGYPTTIKYVQTLIPNWTILVYMNGDNDLESFAIDDINEMEMVGSYGPVSIIVQVDRIPGFDSTNDDWTDTRRYYIVSDSDPNVINSTLLAELGEKNMGDPQTLVDFVTWGIVNYPADRYVVVIWDHGSGWYKKLFADGFDDFLLKGVGFDSTSRDWLGVSDGEWQTAIAAIRDHLSRKVDLVGFDACLMQMWEVMDITDGYADYMVGSEQTENGDGWCYNQFLSALVADPTMSPEELGKEIVDAAVDGDNQNTQSCVDLAQVSALTTAVDNFANELLVAIEDTANETIINNIRTQLTTLGHEFDISSHIDLYDFVSRVSSDNRLPDSLRAAANEAMIAIGNAVTWNRTKPAYVWANGIAIYYPTDPSDYDHRYNNLPVASNTLWDDFIRRFIRGDANGDGVINGADVAYLINYLFVGGPAPQPWQAGDVNCDGFINGADVAYLINYLFIGGPSPGC